MNAVIRHVIESIVPASAMHADAARTSVAAAGAPILEELAARLAGAQHTTQPRTERRTLLICAGDHGVGDPGFDLGDSHPTVVVATRISNGQAAVVDVARAGRARIVLVDAGATAGRAMPPSVIQLGRGRTRNFLREPAMTVVDAILGLEAGIALAMSLSEAGLDVLAVGALGAGSEIAAAALLGGSFELDDPMLLEPMLASQRNVGSDGLERLAAFGGPETAVLAGLMLGAASFHTPIILDGHATGAAALVAATLAPAITGYLIAAHAGSTIHSKILAQLGLSPVFAVGLGYGEGTGAAMVLPLIDQVAALARCRSEPR